MMEDNIISWLLDSEPWIEYGTRVELLGQSEDDPQVLAAREQMVNSAPLKAIMDELKNWPGTVLSSHKSAKQPFHKISFLAELGFNAGDPGIEAITKKMMQHASTDGIIKLPMNISRAYRGTGTDTWGWALCDAPVNLYAAAKLGLRDEI